MKVLSLIISRATLPESRWQPFQLRIARDLEMSQGYVSLALDSLLKKGLIEEQNPGNHRGRGAKKFYSVTAHGLAHYVSNTSENWNHKKLANLTPDPEFRKIMFSEIILPSLPEYGSVSQSESQIPSTVLKSILSTVDTIMTQEKLQQDDFRKVWAEAAIHYGIWKLTEKDRAKPWADFMLGRARVNLDRALGNGKETVGQPP